MPRRQQQCCSRGLEGGSDFVFTCKLDHKLYVAVVTSGDPWLSECFVISKRLLGDRLASVFLLRLTWQLRDNN